MSVLTAFTDRFLIVNGTVLIDLGIFFLLYDYFTASTAYKDEDSVLIFLRFCCSTKNILLGLTWFGDGMQAHVILLQTNLNYIKNKQIKWHIQTQVLGYLRQRYEDQKKRLKQ